MMARASELLIDDVVFRIGAELRRSEKEVRKECDGLRKNWVTTLHDWKLLSEERKNALSLPLMLNCKIQQFVSHNLPVLGYYYFIHTFQSIFFIISKTYQF